MMEELKGSEVAEGLAGAYGLVDLLPVAKGLVERAHIQVAVVDLIELLRVGALGHFHMAIKLGRAGRKYEETYPSSLQASSPCLLYRLLSSS